MKNSGLRAIFFRGLALAIPLMAVVYILIRIFSDVKKLIGPIAEKTGIHKLLGGLTLTVLALLCMVILVFLLGLLMQISAVALIRAQMDSFLTKFIPSLNYMKLIGEENLDPADVKDNWKPVLVFFEQQYKAAFVVEESADLVTLFVTKGTSVKEGEVITFYKRDITMIPVSSKDLFRCCKAYGKGQISLIKPMLFYLIVSGILVYLQ